MVATAPNAMLKIVGPGSGGRGGGSGARPGGNGGSGGGDGQTAAGFCRLHDDQDELDHSGLADQVEAIRALLQSLRLVPRSPNVRCDRLSQMAGKRRACERGEARS